MPRPHYDKSQHRRDLILRAALALQPLQRHSFWRAELAADLRCSVSTVKHTLDRAGVPYPIIRQGVHARSSGPGMTGSTARSRNLVGWSELSPAASSRRIVQCFRRRGSRKWLFTAVVPEAEVSS